jgi:hypothetical protein
VQVSSNLEKKQGVKRLGKEAPLKKKMNSIFLSITLYSFNL